MIPVSPTTLAREAFAVATRERALLIPVIGVFVLVPQLAALLFVPSPPEPAEGADLTALAAAMTGWFQANAAPLVTFMALSLLGQAALATLLLARDGPTVGQAIARGLALLPWLILATVLANFAIGGGILLLILPGLYLLGRTYPLVAVMAAEQWRNPLAALIRTVRLTRGHGWMLFALQAFIWLLAAMPGAIFAQIAGAVASPMVTFVALAAQAAVATAATLANAVLQVGLYRRLVTRG